MLYKIAQNGKQIGWNENNQDKHIFAFGLVLLAKLDLSLAHLSPACLELFSGFLRKRFDLSST